MHLQIQNNWTFGEVLDENAKTHPMLRPYKTFSEKVGKGFVFLVRGCLVLIIVFSLHILSYSLLCRIKKFTAGPLKSP